MALTDNLVAYWKLDEASGTSLADATGNGHTGTISGTVNFTTNGVSMTAAREQNLATIADSGDFNATTDFSISLWQKTNQAGGHYLSYMDNNTQEELLFGIGGTDAYGVGGTVGKPTVHLKNKGNVWYSSSESVDDNSRHHIVLLVNSSSVQIYTDGIRTLNQSIAGTWSAGDRTLRLFNRYVSSPSYYYCYGGLIKEIGRWNREITSTEISQLYNSGNGSSYPFSSTFIPKITIF